MATHSSAAPGSGAIGTRSRTDVENAHAALEDAASPLGADAYRTGALSAYRWALGRSVSAPVTGAPGGGTPPLETLTAEVDAALVQIEDLTRDPAALTYTQGVQEALAWVCGHRDDRP
ncbi:hypothetical protein [Streptomyces meridianus]|uniref:Uncharacterized protein n=1 Tax=Streptomyces meridianus TaxID=2938945 RepID=A0ABT0XBR0_9ACTN|nr:hypothetical protein [Streptomyces meridianus]MCM2579952.1 hypothetical protein [Streptomyces meridianus]